MKKKILIVDDDPDILEAIEIIMRSAGHDVSSESNAENLDKILRNPDTLPALIILDILLSGKDGRLICKKLKNNDLTKHIPIIIVSAYPDIEQSSIKAGADDFLAKPFDIETLLGKVNKLAYKETESSGRKVNRKYP